MCKSNREQYKELILLPLSSQRCSDALMSELWSKLQIKDKLVVAWIQVSGSHIFILEGYVIDQEF